MYKISSSERSYLLDGIDRNIRSDGRARLNFRSMLIESGVLAQSNGSARVSLYDSSTDVLASVKAEIATPSAATPNSGQIIPSISCCPSVSAKLEGRLAEDLNAELTLLVERLLCSQSSRLNFDLTQLGLIPGEKVWNLHIDIRVFDSAGNLPDVIAIAIYAALQNTTLPEIKVVGIEGEERNLEVNSDPAAGKRLDLTKMPLIITLYKIGHSFIVDAILEEEICASAQLSVAVNAEGQIGGIHKTGLGALETREMEAMIETARKLASTLFTSVEKVLEKQVQRDADNALKLIDKVGFFA